MRLDFVHLVFTLRIDRNVPDRCALFGLKQRFEEAFRKVAACSVEAAGAARECGCPYHETFSQALTQDPAALKRYQKPSLPFVFQISPLPPLPNRGGMVEVGLVLAGRAILHTAQYLLATEVMFREWNSGNPHFSVVKMESLSYGGERRVLDFRENGASMDLVATLDIDGLVKDAVGQLDSVTVTLITPMRLITAGTTVKELSFSPFIRALLRRVSAMAYYAGGIEPDFDYKWLAEQSRHVETVETAARWHEWGSNVSGLTGKASFAGDLSEYLPFLLAGELLGVGKGATFGLGRYVLSA